MNVFSQLAETAIPRVVQRRQSQREEMLAKVHTERDALRRAYRVSRKQWIEDTLRQPGGDALRAMLRWVETLGIDDADRLVAEVERADWLRRSSAQMRLLALDMIAERIIRIRETNDLDPFNDPLPGDPLDAFQTVKRLLGVQ